MLRRRLLVLLPLIGLLAVTPAQAQIVRVTDAWQRVYQKLPNLPRANQYVDRRTGRVDPKNTLVTRMIRYHVYVKGRPAFYRLDWKLTLADYLGANDIMDPATYPGADTLTQNPLDRDREIIQKLSRTQREGLIQAILESLVGNPAQPQPSPTPTPTPTPTPQTGQIAPIGTGASLLK